VNQTIAKGTLFTLVAIWLALVSSVAAADDPDFEETHGFLQVVIGGKTYHLDSLIVKAQGADGQLPIALITNGTGRSQAEIRHESVYDYADRARDLAERGWLAVVVMRRGIGHSDGHLLEDRCGQLHVERDLNAAADDLQAAIDVLKRRPDVDPLRIIAIGPSTGGASVVALGARNPTGLLGVVSVSGGLRFNCDGWDEKLVEAYRKYGTTSRVPNLWLYAQNDSIFGPDIVARLHTAFLSGGHDADVVEVGPLNQNGHFLFTGDGMRWLGEMDSFLRRQKLPTWSLSDASLLLKRLNFNDSAMHWAVAYLSAPIPKALAFSRTARHVYYRYDGKAGLMITSVMARSSCAEAHNMDCNIVMENNHWVGSSTQ